MNPNTVVVAILVLLVTVTSVIILRRPVRPPARLPSIPPLRKASIAYLVGTLDVRSPIPRLSMVTVCSCRAAHLAHINGEFNFDIASSKGDSYTKAALNLGTDLLDFRVVFGWTLQYLTPSARLELGLTSDSGDFDVEIETPRGAA